jgi:biotin synthase
MKTITPMSICMVEWLREEDPSRLELLWSRADSVRRQYVGDAVHLRGLIEISNFCVRRCAYCGLRADNATVERYRLSADEIAGCAHRAAALGYGTVVLQSGEDYSIQTAWMVDLIRRIKAETALAVTLSLGERPEPDLAAWRDAGADRYLLRFETSDAELYRRIHPSLPGRTADRQSILKTLGRLGYEIGSGVMVGIPGQSYQSLADDIQLFRTLDLDMIGVGPFIPHPATPLGKKEQVTWLPDGEQVPNSAAMVYKVMALTRLVCPEANIPSTTALATVNRTSGHRLGLARGANVVMPNLTPMEYRRKYEIYPDKVCISEDGSSVASLRECLASLGRTVGEAAGGRIRRSVDEVRPTGFMMELC